MLGLAAVAVELVVGDFAAAHPAPGGRGFEGKSGSVEGRRPKSGRALGLRQGRLLLGWNDNANFERRDRQEFFVDQRIPSHMAIKGRASLAKQKVDIELLAKN